ATRAGDPGRTAMRRQPKSRKHDRRDEPHHRVHLTIEAVGDTGRGPGSHRDEASAEEPKA
ncbi:MAG: hypothetical protein QNJ77_14280, partial [Acidimicrobiia bacterium]|nr:hypothetical protein [Acidimicrobiia bacterium]